LFQLDEPLLLFDADVIKFMDYGQKTSWTVPFSWFGQWDLKAGGSGRTAECRDDAHVYVPQNPWQIERLAAEYACTPDYYALQSPSHSSSRSLVQHPPKSRTVPRPASTSHSTCTHAFSHTYACAGEKFSKCTQHISKPRGVASYINSTNFFWAKKPPANASTSYIPSRGSSEFIIILN
jgi:hypothetical protein